jgi:hypothetical protein
LAPLYGLETIMNDAGSPAAGGAELRHVAGNAERVDLTEGDRKPPELCMVYDYAVAAAERNINWYLTKKKPKQQLSRLIPLSQGAPYDV